MSLQSTNPTTTDAWKKLQTHFDSIKATHLREFFQEDQKRAEKLTIKWDDFYVDFSKNRITTETIDLLVELADEVNLKDAISKYFGGDKINETENRAVLHTALRTASKKEIHLDGENIIPEINLVKQKIKAFTQDVVTGKLKGFSGKAFTDIVNIGIGGSDLGPSMVVTALQYYSNHLKTHFISNIDGDHVGETLKNLDPETTLFIVVSKTFTTQETLTNANTVREWFLKSASEDAIAKHFVAVSTNLEAIKQFGIHENNIFPMWNWVGGRFSLWSAVGLSISLAIGYDNFENLLLGASKMDDHFKNEDFSKNLPVLTALLSIWYTNFFNAETEAIIPYTEYLKQFVAYLQQASMESNGKRIDRAGNLANYQTAPIVWGETGTNSQHAFFQLIHQGTKLIPTDFIGYKQPLHSAISHHDKLMANYFAQTEALLKGKSNQEVVASLEDRGNVRQ